MSKLKKLYEKELEEWEFLRGITYTDIAFKLAAVRGAVADHLTKEYERFETFEERRGYIQAMTEVEEFLNELVVEEMAKGMKGD